MGTYRRVVFYLVLIGILGCQQKTPVHHELPLSSVNIESLRRESVVVFDVRSAEDIHKQAIVNSIVMRWEDFLGGSPSDMGKLIEKLTVTPDKTVIILGHGPKGAGEEGYVAWIFDIFGIQSVYTLTPEFYLKSGFSAISPVSKKSWRPEADPNLFIDAVDFRAYVTQSLPRREWTSKARSQALGGGSFGGLLPSTEIFFWSQIPRTSA